MRKKLFIISAAVLFFTSCEKNNLHQTIENEHIAELVSTNQKSVSYYNISTQVGHTAAGCNGCVIVEGQSIHIDCQGAGNVCNVSAYVCVAPVSGGFYTATTQDSTDLTDEEFFNMPDRSFYTGLDGDGKPCWLNIPAQLAIRDSVTRLFTFNNVYFSLQQIYKNQ